MTTTNKPYRKVTVEQMNGESFTKRVNDILRYYNRVPGLSREYVRATVRQAITNAIDNCDVMVREERPL